MLSLNTDLEEYFLTEKRKIESQFGKLPKSASIPHITLAEMTISEEKEDFILDKICNFFSEKSKISIEINEYIAFKSNFLIAAQVNINKDFLEIFKFLRHLKTENTFLKKDKYFSITKLPHVTLCQANLLNDFDILQNMYQNQEISLSCNAPTLLIRKATSEEKSYKTLKKIDLNSFLS